MRQNACKMFARGKRHQRIAIAVQHQRRLPDRGKLRPHVRGEQHGKPLLQCAHRRQWLRAHNLPQAPHRLPRSLVALHLEREKPLERRFAIVREFP
ncbi:hypothetical protein D3C83_31430 [compost metagenome]